MGQPRNRVNIRSVKVSLGEPAHRHCTMDYGIRIAHQVFEAVTVFECALNPLNGGPRKSGCQRR